MKRAILSERNFVVVLFIMVLVVFTFAQEETKRIEKVYLDSNSSVTTSNAQFPSPESAPKNEDVKQNLSFISPR